MLEMFKGKDRIGKGRAGQVYNTCIPDSLLACYCLDSNVTFPKT